ncbi:hypothetical protein KI387_003040, partial [Taxus chinensis]
MDQLTQRQQPESSGSNNMILTAKFDSSPLVLLRLQISRQLDPYLFLDDEHLAHYARSEQCSQSMYPPIGGLQTQPEVSVQENTSIPPLVRNSHDGTWQ